jgi:3-oxoacyl-[acyl-carrier protein] reductase
MTTAIVTGASGYVGAAVVAALAAPERHIICHYHRNAEGAKAAVAAAERAGATAEAVCADLTDADAARLLVEAADGTVDVLVANAGATADGLGMTMPDDDFTRIVDANLGSAFRCAKAALRPMLRRRHGRIIFVGSVAGLLGNAGQANYAAAKAGLGGLARSLAREVATRGITVNVVAPGVLEEGLAAQRSTGLDALITTIPARRLGTAAEVAAAVAFLASDAAAYVTGTTLAVDGGLAMGC